MIVRYATIPVDPDRRDEALAAIDELVDRTNEEPAAFEYRAAADLQEPNTIRLVEQDEDVAALEAHAEAQHYREFVERLPVFLDGEIRVVGFDVESVTALDVSVGLDRRDGRFRSVRRWAGATAVRPSPVAVRVHAGRLERMLRGSEPFDGAKFLFDGRRRGARPVADAVVRDEDGRRIGVERHPDVLVLLGLVPRETGRHGRHLHHGRLLAVGNLADRLEHAPLVGRDRQGDGHVPEVVHVALEVGGDPVEELVLGRAVCVGICGEVHGEDATLGHAELDVTVQVRELPRVDPRLLVHDLDTAAPALKVGDTREAAIRRGRSVLGEHAAGRWPPALASLMFSSVH